MACDIFTRLDSRSTTFRVDWPVAKRACFNFVARWCVSAKLHLRPGDFTILPIEVNLLYRHIGNPTGSPLGAEWACSSPSDPDNMDINPHLVGSDYEHLPTRPISRYVVDAVTFTRPIAHGLRKALRIHRLMMLYYAKPLVEKDEGPFDPTFGFDWCGDWDAEVREQAGRHVEEHRDRLEMSLRVARGEVPIEPTARRSPSRRCLGWELHQLGEVCLEASGKRIVHQVRPLLEVALPEPVEALLTRIARLAETPRGGPFCVQGEGKLEWEYPRRIQEALDQLDVVETSERQLVAAGWEPLGVTPCSAEPDDGEWCEPDNRTNLIRKFYPTCEAKPNARDFTRLIENVFVTRQCPHNSKLWQVQLDRRGQPIHLLCQLKR